MGRRRETTLRVASDIDSLKREEGRRKRGREGEWSHTQQGEKREKKESGREGR